MTGTSVSRSRVGTSPLPSFVPPAAARSRNMAAIKGRDTRPELFVRQAVHRAGFRYRLHSPNLTGRPDLALPRYGTAVFVQGCFWHGHDCKIAHVPRTNTDYWKAKIQRNIHRDAENARVLRRQGWVVATVWECSLKKGTAALLRRLKLRRSRAMRRPER